MVQLATSSTSWNLEVERGPGWLIIRVHPSGQSCEAPEMADRVWSILNTHFVYRLVLEMDEIEILPSHLMGQLVMLQKRVLQHDGALRLCNMRPECQNALRLTRLDQVLPNYENREDAILARLSHVPR